MKIKEEILEKLKILDKNLLIVLEDIKLNDSLEFNNLLVNRLTAIKNTINTLNWVLGI